MWLISEIVSIFSIILLIYIIVGWLVQFGVINAYNPFVNKVMTVLSAIIEPCLNPIRRVLPNLGGMDFSPVVLILGLNFGLRFLQEMVYGGF